MPMFSSFNQGVNPGMNDLWVITHNPYAFENTHSYLRVYDRNIIVLDWDQTNILDPF